MCGQASRFQILKVHAEGNESKDEKERGDGVEMELAATNVSSLEAWLYTLEVGDMFHVSVGLATS